MATSLHFGPEWMRKAAAKPASSSSLGRSESPSSGRTGSAAQTSATSTPSLPPTRRNPSLGNLGSSGATTAAVASPGAFSFAAAAAGGGGGASSTQYSSSTNSFGALGTDVLDKDPALTYSLYSSNNDGGAKSPTISSDASGAGLNGAGKKKSFTGGALDGTRRSGDGPLSPSLGSGEPRGINARAFSGSAEKSLASGDRPGLFQRGSHNGAAALGLAGSTPSLSPTIPRERFGGIQGGILSGVAPPARKRTDSQNGAVVDQTRAPRFGRFGEETSEGSGVRARSRASGDGGGSGDSSVGVAASQEATGSSLSARFKRTRVPGEGPIGPPADSSIGFGKFSSVARKRERMATTGREDGEESSTVEDQGAMQRAADVLGSLKLDDGDQNLEDSSGINSTQAHALSSDAAPAWSLETAQWVYRDPQGEQQGPFAAHLMQEWFAGNYFDHQLLMRPAEEKDFVPLGQILAALGNPAQPFLMPPPSPWSSLTRPAETQQQQQREAPLQIDQPSQQQQSQAAMGYGGGQQQFASNQGGLSFDGLPQGPSDYHPQSGGGWGAPAANETGNGGRGWPSLDLGFGGPTSAAPMSPFGNAPHSAFGAPQSPFGNNLFAAGGAGMGQHNEHLAMLRQRELQEQRHAAAAAAARGHVGPGIGFAGQFGDAYAASGAGSWDPARGGWVGAQSHLQQQDVFSSPQVQHQQQQQQQVPASPWGNAPSTPSRGGYDSQPAQSPQNFQPQQQHQQMQQQQQQQQQQPMHAPWSNDANAQYQHQQQMQLQHEQRQAQYKPDPAPIGTPRRSRSPAPGVAPATPQADESYADHSFTSAAESDHQSVAEPEQPPREATPEPVPEPAPEEVWPQSPTAVEFATEPSFEEQQAADDFALNASSPARSKRSRRRGQKDEPLSNASSIPGAGGNVKVVSSEQFRREQQTEEHDSRNQVPLSAWIPESSSQTPTALSKAAPWAADGAAPSTNKSGLSLREIQEAEARQVEARRAAERAAAAQRAARTASSGDTDLPSTMTWGLASGHAGGNAGAAAESPSAGGGTPSTPVWSAAARPAAKKTLAQIQEEELKRAQKAREQQAAQAAALRRGYADSASKVQAPAAPAGAGWNVVGAKPSAPAAPATTAARTLAASSTARAASLGSSAVGLWSTAGAKTNGSAGIAAKTLPQSPVVKSSIIKTYSEAPSASNPSPEFLQYCKEQLKGLNVKTDDFIEMLLSFPLDPTPDVVEIIADSVYANSSTLDGRRFASDFVAKRKIDVRGGATSSRSAASNTTRSVSDVLKSSASAAEGATPSSDFGGFKVVKAKGGKKRN